jgi:hypothetical protein
MNARGRGSTNLNPVTRGGPATWAASVPYQRGGGVMSRGIQHQNNGQNLGARRRDTYPVNNSNLGPALLQPGYQNNSNFTPIQQGGRGRGLGRDLYASRIQQPAQHQIHHPPPPGHDHYYEEQDGEYWCNNKDSGYTDWQDHGINVEQENHQERATDRLGAAAMAPGTGLMDMSHQVLRPRLGSKRGRDGGADSSDSQDGPLRTRSKQ